MISDFAHRLKSGLARGACKLSRDERGNVLLLTAAALLPLIGIVGSGIDIGRSYMAQLRLQQACDAGVLAGRRSMANGRNEQPAAGDMFQFNFPNGMYGTRDVVFSVETKGGADLFGSASAILPTSLMHVFGFNQFNLSVDCGAKMEIANTDVMLVLDVTGSMNEVLGSKKKYVALREAAKNFVTTLLGAEQGDGRLRVGVVPYSGTVNVGKILYDKNPDWISKSVTLPTVVATFSSNAWKYTLKDFTFTDKTFVPGENVTLPTGTGQSTVVGKTTTRTQGDSTAKWAGCVMERGAKVPFAAGDTIPSDAYDMSITLVPTSDDKTKWKAFLPDHAFPRTTKADSVKEGSSRSTWNWTSASYPWSFTVYATKMLGTTAVDRSVDGNFGICPTPAMNLTVIEKENDTGHKAFLEVIDKLEPRGLTYHDAGIAWGARLLSPVGLFAYENSVDRTSNKLPISRHIVFMTDGEMYTSNTNYSHQGHEVSMERIGSGSKNDAMIDRQKYRFKQLCERAKQQGIEIWVVSFGTATERTQYNPDIKPCSSRDYVYEAGSSDELDKAFVSIAGQISRLRVSQ